MNRVQINVDLLKQTLPQFQAFLQSPEGKQLREERLSKDDFFKQYFTEPQIDHIDEGVLRKMLLLLWAFGSWANKDYLLQEMLKSGLPAIRSAFKELLYGKERLSKRFDNMRRTVRMMGASGISEVLTHSDPRQYPLWTRRSREGLIALGVDPALIPKSQQITGSQYEQYAALVREVREKVAQHTAGFDDLFELDAYLFFLSLHANLPQTLIPPAAENELTDDFDHDEIIDQLIQLGDGLGFEVQKEYAVFPGCRIDAVWRSRIANLGTISYAFEVHRRGSRDSAILNLQRVRRDPTVQKVVIVSTQEELERFKQEIASLDESFRSAVGYFEVRDLKRALEYVQELRKILDALGMLVRSAG